MNMNEAVLSSGLLSRLSMVAYTLKTPKNAPLLLHQEDANFPRPQRIFSGVISHEKGIDSQEFRPSILVMLPFTVIASEVLGPSL